MILDSRLRGNDGSGRTLLARPCERTAAARTLNEASSANLKELGYGA